MGIPPVDPANPLRGPRWLAEPYARFGRTPMGRWLGINVLTPIDPYLLRWSGGRASIFGIYRHVQLTVPSRTSGLPRTVQLIYFTEDEDVVLMASSFGRPDYPAWYRNVLSHPTVTLTADGESHPYVAREVEDGERDDLFDKATTMYAGFADYQRMIDEAGRHLPIIRCAPVDAG